MVDVTDTILTPSQVCTTCCDMQTLAEGIDGFFEESVGGLLVKSCFSAWSFDLSM